MNPSLDDEVEALLRRQFGGPADDDGFSERVLQQLSPRRRRATWPLWSGAVGGAVACWVTLLPSRLLHAGWQEWVGGHWSAAGAVVLAAMAGMALLALAWSVAEAGER